MIEKLREMEEKYHALSASLADPDILADNKQYAQLMREYKHMTPIMEKFQEYSAAQRDFEEAKELLETSGSDAELKEMAQAEWDESKEKMAACTEELKRMLLPKDPNDDKNVIVEIRAGAGGDEAALFAAEIYRMKVHYADSRRWKTEMIS